MTRLLHVDSARRFALDATTGLRPTVRLVQAAITIGFGLAVSCSPTFAQNAAKGSPDHIKAVTSAGRRPSGQAHSAAAEDWPAIRIHHAATRLPKSQPINHPH